MTTGVPAVVIDLDGVVADPSRRVHWLERDPPDWTAFFQQLGADATIPEGIALVNSHRTTGKNVIWLTGRPEWTRKATSSWLEGAGLPQDRIVMRPDHLDNHLYEFKASAIAELARSQLITTVVDDSPEIVEHLRALGWPAVLFQVGPRRTSADRSSGLVRNQGIP